MLLNHEDVLCEVINPKKSKPNFLMEKLSREVISGMRLKQ